LGQFRKNYRTFYPKIVIKPSKINIWEFGIRGPRFRIRKITISDPRSGAKKAPDPGSGSTTLRAIPPPKKKQREMELLSHVSEEITNFFIFLP
jgi:hypothetical protein